MRYSKDHKAETHERIVRRAAARLKERGVAGLGVAELMQEAGLTHGGFYAHFTSRDALVGEAFAHAMEQTARRWRRRAETAPEGQGLAAIVNAYLTREHRDNVGQGCALPALGAEVVRASPKTRKAFAARIEDMVEVLAAGMPASTSRAARREAIAALATMMGALLLARMAGSGDFSEEILGAGRYAALRPPDVAKPRARKARSPKSGPPRRRA